MSVDYRPLLVTLVISVPVFAAGLTLHQHPTSTGRLELGSAVYAVAPPLTAATVPPTLTGTDASLLSSSVTAPTAPVAVVNEPADRGIAQQVTDTVPPPVTTWPRHPHYDIWLRLAECESGGDWQINTGNGYYGGLQFSLQSWRGVGGNGYPHQASIWEQMFRAEILLDVQGWSAWPACSRKLGLR